LAAVVDLKNTSTSVLSIDVAKAMLIFEPYEPASAVQVTAIGAGIGSLPANTNLGGHLPELHLQTVPPGGELTFWVLFQNVPQLDVRRTVLSIPIQPGAPLVFTLREAQTPRWKWKEKRSEMSLSERLSLRSFDSKADLGELGLAWWYSRGLVRFGVAAQFGAMYERSTTGYSRASTARIETSLAWHPPSWVIGAYVAGDLAFVGSGELDGNPSRRFPGLSVGLESPVLDGRLGAVLVRAGYTRVVANFDHPDAFSISVDVSTPL
jgi:hypothetical protein